MNVIWKIELNQGQKALDRSSVNWYTKLLEMSQRIKFLTLLVLKFIWSLWKPINCSHIWQTSTNQCIFPFNCKVLEDEVHASFFSINSGSAQYQSQLLLNQDLMSWNALRVLWFPGHPVYWKCVTKKKNIKMKIYYNNSIKTA